MTSPLCSEYKLIELYPVVHCLVQVFIPHIPDMHVTRGHLPRCRITMNDTNMAVWQNTSLPDKLTEAVCLDLRLSSGTCDRFVWEKCKIAPYPAH